MRPPAVHTPSGLPVDASATELTSARRLASTSPY